MRGVKWLFFGRDGLRYGWRLLIFAAAIIVVVEFLEQPAIGFLAAKLHVDRSALSARSIIVSDGFDLTVILIVTGVFALCERRRIDSYGLPVDEAFGGFFWNGAIAGLAAIAFVGAGMLISGGMHIHGIALHRADLITSPLLWLIAMLFVGVMEEYLFRGYALQALWRGAGFWPAALITTALFAGDHLEKPHENAIDIGMIFVLGVLLCISVRITSSLWCAGGRLACGVRFRPALHHRNSQRRPDTAGPAVRRHISRTGLDNRRRTWNRGELLYDPRDDRHFFLRLFLSPPTSAIFTAPLNNC